MSSSFLRLAARTARVAAAVAVVLSILPPGASRADNTAQTLPFSQNWSNTGLITVADNWNGVPGIIGYRGDDLTTSTGTDPRNILADGTTTPVNVLANQLNPSTLATGGVAEFDTIANPTVALNGSGTADAPFILINISTLGQSAITVAYNVRDIDGSSDNAVQQVALHYRVGSSGNFTNVPAAYVADATTANSATQSTSISVVLPANAENQPLVQLRVMTTNAVGNDEWVGIDDISITSSAVPTPTPPTGTGSASPNTLFAGASSDLTVQVTPGTNPTSTGLIVRANLSSIGGSSTQEFVEGPANTFTFTATVAPGTAVGPKSLPVTITDAEGRSGGASIGLSVDQPPPPIDHIVISQVYGGGGNGGATYQHDFVELYNPGTIAFDLTGWSLQYASATGSGWAFTSQPIGGVIAPGEYYLVSLATNGAVGAELPAANINGEVNMSGTSGKIALVSNGEPLSGNCPLGDPDLVDFVGYGAAADCHEGTANTPNLSNTLAAIRKNAGNLDTNNNGSDFVAGPPNPRRTAPIVELGPAVFNTDPFINAGSAPRDATITVNFTEPVEPVGVDDHWFHVDCASTGAHDDATVAIISPRSFAITPNVNFLPGETCSVTVFKDFIHDQDLDDAAPDTDTLRADYFWTFRVATGTAPPYPAEVHLTMGNPSAATADLNFPRNYLMEKPEFALSYNRDRGGPNWVSWHLDDTWIGTLDRNDTFRADPAVPPDWYRVQATDFSGSGFDRGHMTPNADRDKETSIPINQATFLMSNMVPQAPDNNQGPWAAFEGYLRTLLPANEVYIVSGPADHDATVASCSGTGGIGSSGPATTIANGHVTVPACTWKVALVLTKDSDDVSRVDASTRTIAVIMPNIQGIRNDDWHTYLTTVDEVERLTGYDFFANVEDAAENSIEAGRDGVNPPGTANQQVTAEEDSPQSFTLKVASTNPSTLTYTILTGPSVGAVTGSGGHLTYSPAQDFVGTDSFTYRVTDSVGVSNTSTVTIQVLEVNDPPTAALDTKDAVEDTALTFPATDLTTNDSAGPANEVGQALTVTTVTGGPTTHGSVAMESGVVTYVPEPDFNGPARFTYEVCDDGSRAGLADPKCATGTVEVEVAPQNDPPVPTSVPPAATVPELATYTFTAQASDVDSATLAFSLVGAPAGASINPSTGQFAWTPTEAQGGTGLPFAFKVRITDGTSNTDADIAITVTEVNQAPALVVGTSHSVSLGETLTFVALGSDGDIPVQALTYGLSGAVPAGASINPATGVFSWTPTASQSGSAYAFNVTVTDGVAPTSVPIAVNAVGPLQIERDVLDRVRVLRNATHDRSDRKSLDDVIDDLTEAVLAKYWDDAAHLDPRKGDRVFDENEEAVRELAKLERECHRRIPDALLQGFIDDLVRATRLLAETAISDAIAAHGDARDIAKAREDLADGNRDAARGRADDAIRDYESAWERALKAVR
jgi:DNA/RNA endonuclease G (NUC1)